MQRTKFKKEYHYVYIITNLITNRQYVGDHTTKRLNDGYLGSGRKLYCSFKRYGRENFTKEILDFFPTRKEAFNAQRKYIKKYNTVWPNGYNLNDSGGIYVNDGHHSKLSKRRISKTAKNYAKTNEGEKRYKEQGEWYKNWIYTTEGKRVQQIINRKRKIWYETNEGILYKQKLSLRQKGENNVMKRSEVKEKNRQFHIGRKQSGESNQKRSKTLLAYYQTDEGKEFMKNRNKSRIGTHYKLKIKNHGKRD
jgi:hypothetical protein